jgi:hypothetical protein
LVLLAQTLIITEQSGVFIDTPSNYPHIALVSKGFQVFRKEKVPTFLDSGASNTTFILKKAFVDYKSIDSQIRDSAKANGKNFEIVGEGNIVQHYLIDGKEHQITYI